VADVAYIPGEPGARVEQRPLVGYAMVVAAALLFSLNGTVSKVVLHSGMSSLDLVQIRSTGAFLGLVAVLLLVDRGSLRLPLRELPFLIVFGAVGVALVQWLYLVAIDRLPVGVGLLIEYLAPLLIALFARFVYHEPVRRRIWAALVCSLTGLALVVKVWSGLAFDGLGITAALAAAFAYAMYVLMAERGIRRRSSSSLTCYGFLFAALFWAIVNPVWTFPFGHLDETVSLSGNLEHVSSPVWLLVLSVIVLGTILTFGLVVAALRHISATRVAIVAMLEPVGATVVAWAWLGESFGLIQLIGGGIVLAGILLAQTAR
jgi:drug/metabolite transporter (DMT)-like permease